VDQWIREELGRVDVYMEALTKPKIQEVLDRELISHHVQQLIEVCVHHGRLAWCTTNVMSLLLMVLLACFFSL
jgi:hypothetical protein